MCKSDVLTHMAAYFTTYKYCKYVRVCLHVLTSPFLLDVYAT